MKTTSKYQIAKQTLKTISFDAKQTFRNDLPAIRQAINDSCDDICRGLKLSEYQRDLLSNYACTLHPKG